MNKNPYKWNIAILSVAHDVGDGRVHRLVGALQEQGCQIQLYGVGDAKNAPPGTSCHTTERLSLLRRLFRSISLPFSVRAQATIVIDPDLFFPAFIARRLKRIPVLVSDVHEDYLKVAEDRKWPNKLIKFISKLLLRPAIWASRKSDLTLMADNHVPPLRAKNRLVVPNLPVHSDLENNFLHLESPPRAVYIGDVRKSRGVFEMIEAIQITNSWEIDIIGPIDPTIKEDIESKIKECERIRIHGRLSPPIARETAKGASVGISFLHDTPAFRESMPTKVYEYADAGMAIITSPLPRPSDFVTELDIGVIAHTVSEIATTLTNWQADPEKLFTHQTNAQSWSTYQLQHQDVFKKAAEAITNQMNKCRN